MPRAMQPASHILHSPGPSRRHSLNQSPCFTLRSSDAVQIGNARLQFAPVLFQLLLVFHAARLRSFFISPKSSTSTSKCHAARSCEGTYLSSLFRRTHSLSFREVTVLRWREPQTADNVFEGAFAVWSESWTGSRGGHGRAPSILAVGRAGLLYLLSII